MHHKSQSLEDTPMTEPVTFQAAQIAPEATEQQPSAPVVRSLESSLVGLDQETREYVLSEVRTARNEARNLRDRAKEAEPIISQWKALEEASKTETQRLTEANAAYQRDAENARAEAIRYKAAATYGISADHFELLGSGNEEQITARAEKLAALISAQTQPAPPTPVAPQRRPVEQMRPGATPGGTESEDDVLFAQLFGTK